MTLLEPRRRLRWVQRISDPALDAEITALREYLQRAGFSSHSGAAAGPGDASGEITVVWADAPLPRADQAALARLETPLVLAGPTLHTDAIGDHTELTGLLTRAATPVHDVRVRPSAAAGALGERLADHDHAGLAHLGEHTHVSDRVLLVDKVADDVEVLLDAAVGLGRHPVAAIRGRCLAWTLGTTAEAVSSPAARRLFVLALRRLLGMPSLQRPIRVGLLGFGAIGLEHARAIDAVAGLQLNAVCDKDPARLAVAERFAPDATSGSDAAALVDGDATDLIVVSTAPDTHAAWALRALAAGKHVVVEKPFAIHTADADRVLACAAERDLLAVVYQNRRFDPDHLAIRRAVSSGRIGDVFHVETFVGGYGHPCNLWHSDAGVSGGAFFDWGAHVVDQILDLIDAPVTAVTAMTHKRMWFDVTNADHSRLTVLFDNGVEAEFVYSDLAAARKPRWYVLGTRGAIVGNWRVERVVTRTDVGTLAEDVLAPADSPPVLDLHDAEGSVTRLATPAGGPYAFHRELTDALLLGLPMQVTGESSRRVMAVLEAAAESAADGGRPVVPS